MFGDEGLGLGEIQSYISGSIWFPRAAAAAAARSNTQILTHQMYPRPPTAGRTGSQESVAFEGGAVYTEKAIYATYYLSHWPMETGRGTGWGPCQSDKLNTVARGGGREVGTLVFVTASAG